MLWLTWSISGTKPNHFTLISNSMVLHQSNTHIFSLLHFVCKVLQTLGLETKYFCELSWPWSLFSEFLSPAWSLSLYYPKNTWDLANLWNTSREKFQNQLTILITSKERNLMQILLPIVMKILGKVVDMFVVVNHQFIVKIKHTH